MRQQAVAELQAAADLAGGAEKQAPLEAVASLQQALQVPNLIAAITKAPHVRASNTDPTYDCLRVLPDGHVSTTSRGCHHTKIPHGRSRVCHSMGASMHGR